MKNLKFMEGLSKYTFAVAVIISVLATLVVILRIMAREHDYGIYIALVVGCGSSWFTCFSLKRRINEEKQKKSIHSGLSV